MKFAIILLVLSVVVNGAKRRQLQFLIRFTYIGHRIIHIQGGYCVIVFVEQQLEMFLMRQQQLEMFLMRHQQSNVEE